MDLLWTVWTAFSRAPALIDFGFPHASRIIALESQISKTSKETDGPSKSSEPGPDGGGGVPLVQAEEEAVPESEAGEEREALESEAAEEADAGDRKVALGEKATHDGADLTGGADNAEVDSCGSAHNGRF